MRGQSAESAKSAVGLCARWFVSAVDEKSSTVFESVVTGLDVKHFTHAGDVLQ